MTELLQSASQREKDGGAGIDTVSYAHSANGVTVKRSEQYTSYNANTGVFSGAAGKAQTGGDTIADFNAGDKFRIEKTGFGGGLSGATLSAAQFQATAGHVAATANVRFMFDTSDRTLYYDADSSGVDAAVAIATLDGAYVLKAGDFILV